jgi:hypothetical protein
MTATRKKAAKKTAPVRNDGARQPKLDLPTVMPGGKKTDLHPFLWAIENRFPKDKVKADVAKEMEIRPQSLYKWEAACRKDRNFPLPILRAAQFAKLFRMPPSMFRPDAYKPSAAK